MIFILLPYLSGCTTTKIISTSDLPLSDSKKYAYIVHCETVNFLLEKPVISNDTLSANIKQAYTDNYYDAGDKIHLYLSSDSAIKINNKGEFLSLPLANVTKVELQGIHGVAASSVVVLTLAGMAFFGLLIYGLVSLASLAGEG
jgi:hypothetical protein